MKVEVKSTQTEETQCLTDGMSNEVYELMVRGRLGFIIKALHITSSEISTRN